MFNKNIKIVLKFKNNTLKILKYDLKTNQKTITQNSDS